MLNYFIQDLEETFESSPRISVDDNGGFDSHDFDNIDNGDEYMNDVEDDNMIDDANDDDNKDDNKQYRQLL